MRVGLRALLTGRVEPQDLVLHGARMRLPWPLAGFTLRGDPAPGGLHARVEDGTLTVGGLPITAISGEVSPAGRRGAVRLGPRHRAGPPLAHDGPARPPGLGRVRHGRDQPGRAGRRRRHRRRAGRAGRGRRQRIRAHHRARPRPVAAAARTRPALERRRPAGRGQRLAGGRRPGTRRSAAPRPRRRGAAAAARAAPGCGPGHQPAGPGCLAAPAAAGRPGGVADRDRSVGRGRPLRRRHAPPAARRVRPDGHSVHPARVGRAMLPGDAAAAAVGTFADGRFTGERPARRAGHLPQTLAWLRAAAPALAGRCAARPRCTRPSWPRRCRRTATAWPSADCTATWTACRSPATSP